MTRKKRRRLTGDEAMKRLFPKKVIDFAKRSISSSRSKGKDTKPL